MTLVMSVGTMWVIAELELMALAEQLGVANEPELVLATEEGSSRVDRASNLRSAPT
jgi:hypothetical protein